MKFSKSFRISVRSEYGGALLTMMFVLALVGFLIVAMTRMMEHKITTQNMEKLKSIQAHIAKGIESALIAPETIKHSAASSRNDVLSRCLNTTQNCPPDVIGVPDAQGKIPITRYRAFDLFDASRARFQKVDLIAGAGNSTFSNVYYTLKGRTCPKSQFINKNNPQCAFKAVPYFVAVCPDNTTSCRTAASIRFKYRLCTNDTCFKNNQGNLVGKMVQNSKTGIVLANYPNFRLFSTSVGKSIPEAVINNRLCCDRDVCTSDTIQYQMTHMTGVSSSGNPICRCSWDCDPTKKIGPCGFPRPEQYRNALNKIIKTSNGLVTNCDAIAPMPNENYCMPQGKYKIVGREANGRLICKPISPDTTTFNVSDNNPNGTAACENNTYTADTVKLQGLGLGDCYEQPNGTIECGTNTGKCKADQ